MTNLCKLTESSKFHPLMSAVQIDEVLKVDPWLNDADFENAIIEIDDKRLVWSRGIWKDGTRKTGVWGNGTWENGVWIDGISLDLDHLLKVSK